MDQINQFRAYVRDIDNRFGIWKKQILSLMLFVAVVLVFKSYNNQHQEVRLIQQSLSNFYRDFDVSMLKDPSELKNLVAKIAEISAPITSLEQIHKASRDVDKKIEILQNFELDKTGRADLASKAAGGKIAGIGAETQLFYSCNVFMKLLNCPTRIYGPEKVIESSTQPGQCFCFLGQKGSVILRLAGSAVVDAMTVEHIPKQMSPKGGVREAPKHFNCSGFNSREEPEHLFGSFKFLANDTSIQTFNVRKSTGPVKYVKFDFEENNGNPNKTCVYRLRVHGVLVEN